MSKVIVECPSCAQKLRVPNEKGSILVTCGSCDLQWMYEPPETEVPSAKTGIGAWFDKKKRSLTGSSARITIENLEQVVKAGDLAELTVQVIVAESAIDIKGVRVDLVGEEIVTLPWNSVRRSMGTKFDAFNELWNLLTSKGNFIHAEELFSAQYKVSGPESWTAGSKNTFNTKLKIPTNAMASFQGRSIAVQWRIQATVETSAVDPKTDWLLLEVKP